MRRLTGLFLILFVLSVAVMAEEEWFFETVDSGNRTGKYCSLALDSANNPHIAYYTGWVGLVYASRDNSSWQIETADSDGSYPFGLACSLILDSDDNAHISYDGLDSNLSYAFRNSNSSGWRIQNLTDNDGSRTCIGLRLGRPFIYHAIRDVIDINHPHRTSWTGTYWSTHGVSGNSIGEVKYEQGYHRAYIDEGYLMYNSERVDQHSGVYYPSIDIDSSYYPHIAYYRSYRLNYARWDGSTWQLEYVDACRVGNTSIAVDSYNNPHIVYQNKDNDTLQYAFRDSLSSEWTVEILDRGRDVGEHLSLALDSCDNPHIAYQANNGRLEYAYYGYPHIENILISGEPTDDGILLSWAANGGRLSSSRILRQCEDSDLLDVSGELDGSATSWMDGSAKVGVDYTYYIETIVYGGTYGRFGPSDVFSLPDTVFVLDLDDPYPNPAGDTLTVNYELAANGAVSLRIYDLSGRLVETLVSGEQTAGRHSVNWDSSVAATGVYLLRLEANGEAITKRAVISR